MRPLPLLTRLSIDVTFIMANAYRLEADNQLKVAVALQNAVSTSERNRADTAKQKSNDYYDRFFDLCDKYLALAHQSGAKEEDKKYAKDFVNMMGSVYFKLKRYGDLLEKFAGYENGVMNKSKGYVNLPNFRDSPAMPSAHYMSGLALLATGKFKEAKPLLAPVVGVSVQGLPLEDPNLVQEGDSELDEKQPAEDANETE